MLFYIGGLNTGLSGGLFNQQQGLKGGQVYLTDLSIKYLLHHCNKVKINCSL